MTVTEPAGLAEMKQATRRTWASGDYDAVARRIAVAGGRADRAARRHRRRRGRARRRVRYAATPPSVQRRRGGRVVGVDLTPELFDAGRRNAEARRRHGGLARGRRRGAAVRRRELRRRALGVRLHVRAAARRHRARARARAASRWTAGVRVLDARGFGRPDVPRAGVVPAARAAVRPAAGAVGHRGARAGAVRRHRAVPGDGPGGRPRRARSRTGARRSTGRRAVRPDDRAAPPARPGAVRAGPRGARRRCTTRPLPTSTCSWWVASLPGRTGG